MHCVRNSVLGMSVSLWETWSIFPWQVPEKPARHLAEALERAGCLARGLVLGCDEPWPSERLKMLMDFGFN